MPSLGSTPGLIVAAGVGAAASVALEPAFEIPKQNAWARLPHRILDVGTLAQLVAQGGVLLGDPDGSTHGSAYDEARRQGFSSDKLDRLVWLEQHAPDLAEVLRLWRRGVFGKPETAEAQKYVDFALGKEQIEPRYWKPLKELFYNRLSPAEIALGIVRSVVKDPGILPVTLDLSGTTIERYPVLDVDAYEEARASGIDGPRLTAMVGTVGLPMSLHEAASAYFRAVPTGDSKTFSLSDFHLAVLEGDTRPEWATAILEQARQILSANNYAELELRGFLDAAQRRKKTDQHGMSHADSDSLVDMLGRSITVHQVTTGLARGGKYPGSYTNVPEPFKSAIQRSNIREEWAELDYVNRFTYPTGFQIKAETKDGNLTAAQAEQILLELGWKPEWAKFFADAWAAQTATTAKANPYQAKADNHTWTAIQNAYVKTGALQSQVDPLLEALVPDPAVRLSIFAIWDIAKAANALVAPPA